MIAQLADGRRLEFPEGTDPAVVQATVKKVLAASPKSDQNPTSAGNMVGAAVEPNLKLLTGMVASPLAGLAGIAGSVLPGPSGQGADYVRKVQDTLTYQPKTTGGKNADSVISYLPEKVGWLADRAGDFAAQGTDSPLAGTVINTVIQAAPALLGLKGPSTAAKVGRVADSVGTAGYRLIEPMLPNGPRQILDRYQSGLIPEDGRARVIAALQDAKEIVPGSLPTSGEALAALPDATALAAHQRAISGVPDVSPRFVAREAEQQSARRAALDAVAKDKGSLSDAILSRAANAEEAYGPIRGRLIDPRSDVELMQEAIRNRAASKASALQDQGRFATTAAQNEIRADEFTPAPGMPRVPARLSEFSDRATEAASAANEAGNIARQRGNEAAFLQNTMDLLKDTVGLDDKSLYPLLNRPSMKAAVQDAIRSAQETGSYFPSAAGDKFSVDNLQRIKQSLDDVIKDPPSFGIKATEAKEIGATRDAFIKWLSNKSPEWKDARLQYAEDSRPINQMQIGQYLQQKLTQPLEGKGERAGVFAQAVRDAPGTIKRATGAPRYDDLSQILSPDQLESVSAVNADLARKAQFESLANGTNLSGGASIAEGAGAPHLPHLLSRPAMVANFFMKLMGESADKKINRIAANRYLNPAELSSALEAIPPGRAPSRLSLSDAALAGATAPQTFSEDAQRRQAVINALMGR